MQIIYKELSELIPYERNAKLHPESQIAKIALSIQEFGFCNPVLVDGQNGIIAGHARVMAARQVGLVEVPVIWADDLTEEQVRAYRIADNKLAESDYYESILRSELLELKASGIDIENFMDIPIQVEQEESKENRSSALIKCPFCGYEFGGEE